MICIITPLVVGAATGVVSAGIGTLGRESGVPVGARDIGGAARTIQQLRAQGLTPRVRTGPFGNLIIGTADQPLDLLAEEAAIRQINQEVLAELLAEDPLLFIRGLPVGDPRRVAAGIDPPTIVGRIAPSASAAPGSATQVRVPARAVQGSVPARRAAPFFTRALGRFAVR